MIPWGVIKDTVYQAGLELYSAFVIFLMIKLYSELKKMHKEYKALKNEDFETLSKILSDNDIKENTFLIEQLLERKYGKSLSWREISYILNLISPSESLAYYMSGRIFLKYDVDDDQPSFSGMMSKTWYRNTRKAWNCFWYMFFVFLGLALVPLSYHILTYMGPQWFAMTVMLLFCSLGIAYLCLRGYSDVKSAERFLEIVLYSERIAKKTKRKWYY